MMKPTHYYPILKAKAGEIDALSRVKPERMGFLTPILEVPPPGYKRVKKAEGVGKEAVRRTLAEHVQNVTRTLLSRLAVGPRLFLDGHFLRREGLMPDGSPPLAYIVRTLAEAGLRAGVVVRSHGRDRDITALEDLIGERQCEVCLRLGDADYDPSAVQRNAEATTEALGLREHEVELLLDFGAISEDRVRSTCITAEAICRAVRSGSWKTVVAAATSYDRWPAGVGIGEPAALPRWERTVFEAAMRGAGDRRLQYGDFGVSGYQMVAPSDYATAGVKLRYTTTEHYLLYYAGQLTDVGGEGFRSIASRVVRNPAFTPKLSWGDEFLEECVKPGADTGGTATWAAVGTSHHVSILLRDLGLL
jgi:hypothetical protein